MVLRTTTSPRSPVRWLMAVAALMLVSAPAMAHKGKKHGGHPTHTMKAPAETRTPAAVPPGSVPTAAPSGTSPAEPPPGFLARLQDWLGRLHPIVVHFPMAFLPAAWFTALVGRRRPGFAAPVQFLVVAGGAVAALSALLGWLNAGFAPGSDDGLLRAHRWIGTFIGIVALFLAVWAARRPERDRSMAMILGLTIITAAIVAQGWLGGALVHGVDHLNW